MNLKINLLATLIVSGALSALPANAQTKYASKADFIEAVAGKSISTTTKSGKSYTATYNSKGSGTFIIGDASPAKFTWTFKDGVICSSFKTLNFTECNKVEIVSSAEVNFIDAKSGQLNNSYSVK